MTLCSGDNICLPFIWEIPVIPGIKLNTTFCSGEYFSVIEGISGLGPTRLISPFRTFITWGNSSILVRLKNFPTRVIRGSFACVSSGPIFNALSTIPRNLYILKISPLYPVRFATKKTGPFESSFIATIVINNIGEVTIRSVKLIRISVNRLMKLPCRPIKKYRDYFLALCRISVRTSITRFTFSSFIPG